MRTRAFLFTISSLTLFIASCASFETKEHTHIIQKAKQYFEQKKTAWKIAPYHFARLEAYPAESFSDPARKGLTEVQITFWQEDCQLAGPFIELDYDPQEKLVDENIHYDPKPYVDLKLEKTISVEEVLKKNIGLWLFPEKFSAIKVLSFDGKQHRLDYEIPAKRLQDKDYAPHLFRASDGKHIAERT